MDSFSPNLASLPSGSLCRQISKVRAVCVNAPVRICAGGDQRWSSIPRHQVVITPGAAQSQPGGGTCTSYGGGIGPGIVTRPCSDAYIIKQDAAGTTVFATYLGGPTDDAAMALAIDSAGSVYVAGTTGGTFSITPKAALATLPAGGTFATNLSAE